MISRVEMFTKSPVGVFHKTPERFDKQLNLYDTKNSPLAPLLRREGEFSLIFYNTVIFFPFSFKEKGVGG
jgi:hypothetical protein